MATGSAGKLAEYSISQGWATLHIRSGRTERNTLKGCLNNRSRLGFSVHRQTHGRKVSYASTLGP